MPGPDEHQITIDDRGTVGAELTCQTCGWEQHVPSMKVAEILAAEHRESPEYADQQSAAAEFRVRMADDSK
jgi:hypothetical protein